MWMPKISKVDAWMNSRRLCEDFFVPIIKNDVFDIIHVHSNKLVSPAQKW